MKSLKQKLDQVDGLTDTQDLTDWEHGFVKNIVECAKRCGSTAVLTPRQVEILDRIYDKHFA